MICHCANKKMAMWLFSRVKKEFEKVSKVECFPLVLSKKEGMIRFKKWTVEVIWYSEHKGRSADVLFKSEGDVIVGFEKLRQKYDLGSEESQSEYMKGNKVKIRDWQKKYKIKDEIELMDQLKDLLKDIPFNIYVSDSKLAEERYKEEERRSKEK